MTDTAFSRGIRVDWTIPAPMLFAMLLQLAVAVWWGGSISSRVTALESSVRANSDAPATLARLDERTASLQDSVKRIEDRLPTR